MTDLIMCNNHMCPQAMSCKRHRAQAEKYQTYHTYTYSVSSSGVVCSGYIPAWQVTQSANTKVVV